MVNSDMTRMDAEEQYEMDRLVSIAGGTYIVRINTAVSLSTGISIAHSAGFTPVTFTIYRNQYNKTMERVNAREKAS